MHVGGAVARCPPGTLIDGGAGSHHAEQVTTPSAMASAVPWISRVHAQQHDDNGGCDGQQGGWKQYGHWQRATLVVALHGGIVSAGLAGQLRFISRFVDDCQQIPQRGLRWLVHHTRGVRQQIHGCIDDAGGGAQ